MKIPSRLTLTLLLIVIVALPVCAKKKKDKAETATPDDQIVAQLAGEPITLAELEQEASGGLKKLEQDRYELLRNTLEQLATNRMIESEASTRGLSSEALLKVEIEDKVVAPTPEEVAEFYEANKERAGGRTLEQVRTGIENILKDQRLNELRGAFLNDLKARSNFRVLLDPPRSVVPIGAEDPVKGPPDAPITIIEFADFQCPYCRRAHPALSRLLDAYSGKIRFVFRDYPLDFHKRAVPASVAARCAGDQGKYWDMYENMMVMTGDLGDADLEKRAADVGLDVEEFKACTKTDRHQAAIDAAFADGKALGVTGTPSFFINGRMIVGAKPYEDLRAVVEEELALLNAAE